MAFRADIKTALDNASLESYAQYAPPDASPPYAVFRVLNGDPLGTLQGSAGTTNYVVAFHCFATTLEEAETLRAAVIVAIEGSGMVQYREAFPGEDYIPEVNEFVEPVHFGFWYDE